MSARLPQAPKPAAVPPVQNSKTGIRSRLPRQSQPPPTVQALQDRKTKTSLEAQNTPEEADDHPLTGARTAAGSHRHRTRRCEAAQARTQSAAVHPLDREAESRYISLRKAHRANTPRLHLRPDESAAWKAGALRRQHPSGTAAANGLPPQPAPRQCPAVAAASAPVAATPQPQPKMAKDRRHTQFESGKATHPLSPWKQAVSLAGSASLLSSFPAQDPAGIPQSSSRALDEDTPDESPWSAIRKSRENRHRFCDEFWRQEKRVPPAVDSHAGHRSDPGRVKAFPLPWATCAQILHPSGADRSIRAHSTRAFPRASLTSPRTRRQN